jgi:hypothetical protein
MPRLNTAKIIEAAQHIGSIVNKIPIGPDLIVSLVRWVQLVIDIEI